MAAEGWQILSPVRAGAHGVTDLSRLIHKQFRQPMIDASRQRGWNRKYPKPMGGEQIVYGDKVINMVNIPDAALESTSPCLSRQTGCVYRQRRDWDGGRLLLARR